MDIGMEDMPMSSKTVSVRGGCAAALLAVAALGFAAPASAQYSGNPALRNPGASTPSPHIRQGSTYVPPSNPNPYWRPGQFRSDMPGGGTVNPGVRGTNATPCPPSRPNCIQ